MSRYTPSERYALNSELTCGSGLIKDAAVQVQLPNGARPEVDAVSVDGNTLVEIYAHQGPLKGGHVHKVARDTLKLITIARTMPGASLYIAFA